MFVRHSLCVPPEARLTNLELSWLKALLSDQRFSLFFSDKEIAALDTALSDVEPLYSPKDFYIFDGAADVDDVTSP